MKKNTSKTTTEICQKAAKRRQNREKFANYIGIDLGDKQCEMAIFDDKGEFVDAQRLAMKPGKMREFFQGKERSAVAI
jgi:hypothetical protein